VLNKLIHTYQNTKQTAIKRFSNQEYDILEEPGFQDNEFIKKKIEVIKKEHKMVDKQLEQLLKFDKEDEYNKQKVLNLLEQKDNLHIYMAFLASNSFNGLEFSKQLLKDMMIDFRICIDALTAYIEGNVSLALELFEKYYSNHPEPLNHFLINKVYGSLLLKNQPEKAVVYLRKSAEKRPEDVEVHIYLAQAYESLGEIIQEQLHKEILQMLGGDKVDNHSFSK
jgi:predicted Zn-dependent protease